MICYNDGIEIFNILYIICQKGYRSVIKFLLII